MGVLTDFSSEAVDAAVTSNFLYFIDEIGEIPDAEIYRGKDLIRVMVPSVPHPLFNMVARTRLDDNLERIITETMAVYTERNIPFLWQLDSDSRPVNLGDKLVEQGMQALSKNAVLVADLDVVTEAANAPDGYEIKRVEDDESLRAFGEVFGAGFQLPQMVLAVMLKIIHRTEPQANIMNFVGFLDGVPVSAGSTLYAAGVAGFYNGTVLETARGKGIGTANALYRLQAARERGYRLGFMISGGNAYNLYRRLGFKEYAPLQRYMWMPAAKTE